MGELRKISVDVDRFLGDQCRVAKEAYDSAVKYEEGGQPDVLLAAAAAAAGSTSEPKSYAESLIAGQALMEEMDKRLKARGCSSLTSTGEDVPRNKPSQSSPASESGLNREPQNIYESAKGRAL